MSCCSTDAHSKEIDTEIKKESKKNSKEYKILLLGMYVFNCEVLSVVVRRYGWRWLELCVRADSNSVLSAIASDRSARFAAEAIVR